MVSIEAKLERIREGRAPRLLDLFSGCGGLALGFVSAGCVSVGGVELDEDAAESYAVNFHRLNSGEPDTWHTGSKNILHYAPQVLLDKLEKSSSEKGVDLIVGGPPCPAFTRIGRAKLREVRQHPEAFKHDPRARLYLDYLKYVAELRPVALVMENVPDVLNWGGLNLGDVICSELERLDYRCTYTLLNAANYGVPQMRERFFLAAVHKKARVNPSFPTPTRSVEFPPGYSGSRKVALKNILAGDHSWYREPPLPHRSAPRPVTAEEALGDLPGIHNLHEYCGHRGPRKLDGHLEYGGEPASGTYAHLMRYGWPGFKSPGYLRDHVTRYLTMRDYRIFEIMKPGEDYPKAYAYAEKFFAKELDKRQRKGQPLKEGTPEYEKLRAAYVPPYDPGKFPNKWRKMDAKEPARTLMAHLGKDTYSHIHYDSSQRRVISVREAARLQSFPDGFRFEGKMNSAFRQIGNSVPPLLAWAIADELLLSLQAKNRKPSPERVHEHAPAQDKKVRVA
jgi:DNA (cytosine-5)-methyltransferase 1